MVKIPWRGAAAAAFLALLLAPAMSADFRKVDSERLGSLDQRVDELARAGKYREAVPLAEEHQKLTEKAFGPQDPKTAASLNKLAELYHQVGNFQKARTIAELALRIRERAGENADTAATWATLAEIHQALADYARAETFFERALALREKLLGPEHADTATSLAKLANLNAERGEFGKAKELAERSLKIREKLFGPENAETAVSVQLLADIAQLTGRDAEDKELTERALKIREKLPGAGSSRHRGKRARDRHAPRQCR